MQYQIITHDKDLEAFCNQAKQVDAIAVDTEFVRTRTLYPQLGLVQIFDGKDLVLVDPLAINEFDPLIDLMQNPNVVKVLHSCSEDIEAFWSQVGIKISPVFDTQFAASVIGMPATMGYAKLVEHMLGLKLDKGESRTDWLARPLSPEQCQYAANDVLYLFKLYPQLKKQADLQQRTDWIFAESSSLVQKKLCPLPSDYAYLNIKNSWKLSPKSLYVLKLLAQWRVDTAKKRDIALNFIVKESNLLEVARTLPKNKTELFGVPGISVHEARRNGEALLAMVNKVSIVPPELYPNKIERLVDFPAYKQTSAAIKKICIEHANKLALPIELFASKKLIHQVLKWRWFELDDNKLSGLKPDLLYGWRGQFVKEQIDEIVGVSSDSSPN